MILLLVNSFVCDYALLLGLLPFSFRGTKSFPKSAKVKQPSAVLNPQTMRGFVRGDGSSYQGRVRCDVSILQLAFWEELERQFASLERNVPSTTHTYLYCFTTSSKTTGTQRELEIIQEVYYANVEMFNIDTIVLYSLYFSVRLFISGFIRRQVAHP